MHKTVQSQKAIKPKTNIIPFPNRMNPLDKTIIPSNNLGKEDSLKTTQQDKEDDSSLIFEMLLALKEQLDSIQTQLKSLSTAYKLKHNSNNRKQK